MSRSALSKTPRGDIRRSFRRENINFIRFLPNAASKQSGPIVRYPREVSRNADVSVLWLNAPFISARIRLSGERASVVTYTRVYAGVAMHFTYFGRLECRPFAPLLADVIQPSVIPCIRGPRCSRHPVRIYFLVQNRNAVRRWTSTCTRPR